MAEAQLQPSDLRQFTGGDQWYRHNLARKVVYTEGVKFLADRAGAHWLVDKIAIMNQFEPKLKGEKFQVWKLRLVPGTNKATLTCEDGNAKVLLKEDLDFTDFPFDTDLWVEVGEQPCILLPSEH